MNFGEKYQRQKNTRNYQKFYSYKDKFLEDQFQNDVESTVQSNDQENRQRTTFNNYKNSKAKKKTNFSQKFLNDCQNSYDNELKKLFQSSNFNTEQIWLITDDILQKSYLNEQQKNFFYQLCNEFSNLKSNKRQLLNDIEEMNFQILKQKKIIQEFNKQVEDLNLKLIVESKDEQIKKIQQEMLQQTLKQKILQQKFYKTQQEKEDLKHTIEKLQIQSQSQKQTLKKLYKKMQQIQQQEFQNSKASIIQSRNSYQNSDQFSMLSQFDMASQDINKQLLDKVKQNEILLQNLRLKKKVQNSDNFLKPLKFQKISNDNQIFDKSFDKNFTSFKQQIQNQQLGKRECSPSFEQQTKI